MQEKLARLRENLSGMGRVLVAFSGGVDSSFVLRVAHDVLGQGVTALTTRSPTAVEEDFDLAVRLAGELGIQIGRAHV